MTTAELFTFVLLAEHVTWNEFANNGFGAQRFWLGTNNIESEYTVLADVYLARYELAMCKGDKFILVNPDERALSAKDEVWHLTHNGKRYDIFKYK